ncbi:ABC transporter permease subunit [Corynebacterium sp. zg254]|uniref:ABC transporter permease n=1 Tax=Corynebacterium zhongnanshanii TaxID=2768834 RepID=A0ABQ6VBQ9_9CORY|nr:ABC transporter permease [Corynebacterium zhongnanshanii]KAB3519181.1 ABC transporter permease [Corynebacterium zhongnanshanii]MCR5915033.1 ABC transporter permease subunit [Corynebacterium sp. zg254]
MRREITDQAPPSARQRFLKLTTHRRVLQIGSVLVFLLAWWAITRFGNINPTVLPSPIDVFHQLIVTNQCTTSETGRVRCGAQDYYLWQHLLATLQRIGVGVGAGTIVGVLLGWLLGISANARAVVEPYLGFLRALPPLGYIGLLIVWFGIGDVSKVVLLFAAVFPTVAVGTLAGVLSVKQDWIRAAKTLGANSLQILRRVTIPAALPHIITSIRIGTGLAWSAIVAAELNDGIPGIGGLAYISGTQLDTALTIACIIVIGITALIIDQLLIRLERRCTPWVGK